MRYKGVLVDKDFLALELKGLEREFNELEEVAKQLARSEPAFRTVLASLIGRLIGVVTRPI
jgi:hypothetical protein